MKMKKLYCMCYTWNYHKHFHMETNILENVRAFLRILKQQSINVNHNTMIPSKLQMVLKVVSLASSISITWELDRNAHCQASLQTQWIRNRWEPRRRESSREKEEEENIAEILMHCKGWEPLLYTTMSFLYFSHLISFLIF